MIQQKTTPERLRHLQMAASVIAAISIDITDSYALEAENAVRRHTDTLREVSYRLALLHEARTGCRVSLEALVHDLDAYWNAADSVHSDVKDAALVLDSSIKLALPADANRALLVPLLRGIYIAEGVCLACMELLSRLREAGLRNPRFAVRPSRIKNALFQVVRSTGHIETARTVALHPSVRHATIDITAAIIQLAAAQL